METVNNKDNIVVKRLVTDSKPLFVLAV